VCQALSITPANEDNPFESIRYVNGPVSAAWQMLHTAYLILTLSQSGSSIARLTLLSSSEVAQKVRLYPRRIVSNSMSNHCTIAWANAVQLLTVAGQCLVEAREQQACLRVLEDIQHHTGWDTRSNMERLSSAWRRRTAVGESTRYITSLTSCHADSSMFLYGVSPGGDDPPRL